MECCPISLSFLRHSKENLVGPEKWASASDKFYAQKVTGRPWL
jgi:hypothetical protein